MTGIVLRAGAPVGMQVYSTAREIQELSPGEASRAHRVKLRGVITFVDKQTGDMFVQDRTAGIFIFIRKSTADSALRAGQLVTVDGLTTAGDFSPCVTKAKIKVIGSAPFPNPIRPSIDVLMAGQEDGHWAEIAGVVRSGQVEQGRLLLNLSIRGGSIVAITPEYPADWAESLIDSNVILRGAIAQLHNDRRQSVGVRLMIPPGLVRIEVPAPADPFRLPESSTAAVRAYRGDRGLEHRVRVRASVIGIDPGRSLYVAGPGGNLEVQGYPACVAKAGDIVDVVGFPGSVGTRPGLLDSACRQVPGWATMNALDVDADQVLVSRSAADPSGYGFAAGMRFDLNLIQVGGRLIQSSFGPQGYVLQLESRGKQFAANLPAGDQRIRLQNGSRLQLTGVCLVSYDQYRRAESFRILLRAARDIVVVEAAPWWNLKNAFWALSLMAVFLLLAILWVARQTVHLRRANASLRRLSFQDGLTGVANRRKFDDTLQLEFRRAFRHSTSLSMLMVDVDHFKALNDRYGHQRGDECLMEVARALQSVPLRSSDLVARYGGEEFAVILPASDAEGAMAVAERVRLAVLDLAISHEFSSSSQLLSVSAGVATIYPNETNSSSALIALADQALYQSKTGGRNRISYLDARAGAALATAPA